MRILMIAINDPAGAAGSLARALNRYTGHTCRLITLEVRYNHLFEKDMHLPWLLEQDEEAGLAEVEALLRESDVFHFHMTADEDLALGPFVPRDYMAGKMLVHHHHGHPDFRGNPSKYQDKYKKRGRNKLLVSTPDLLTFLPGAAWQPNLVPVWDLAYLPMAGKPTSPVRVAHSPTRKELKNTDELMAVMDKLLQRGLPVELDLIEDTPHAECLRRKRRSHILFDHLQGYFGVSSLEALAQGLAVVAGLDDWNQQHVRAFAQEDRLPWVISSLEKLENDLTDLISDIDKINEIGAYARDFMERCWNEVRVAGHLADFYAA